MKLTVLLALITAVFFIAALAGHTAAWPTAAIWTGITAISYSNYKKKNSKNR